MSESSNKTSFTSVLDLMRNGSPDDTSNKTRLVRDTLVEFVATTLFVYGGTLGAVSTGQKLNGQGNVAEDVARILPIAMSFGVSILAMVYSIGHLSGYVVKDFHDLLMPLQISCYGMTTFLEFLFFFSWLFLSYNQSRNLGVVSHRSPTKSSFGFHHISFHLILLSIDIIIIIMQWSHEPGRFTHDVLQAPNVVHEDALLLGGSAYRCYASVLARLGQYQ